MAARKLFQDGAERTESDEENSVNLLIEELKRSSEEAKKKWNFDFANEKPLEGNWEWEKIEYDDISDQSKPSEK